jgi:outer membrane protein TolC
MENFDKSCTTDERCICLLLTSSMILYVQGAIDYLTVVTSQTALLQTQLQALELDTLQLSASVSLIRALDRGLENTDLRD